jgi:hypothetical protein
MPEDQRRSDPVVQLEPPAAEPAWSEAVVAQTLEILFVSIGDHGPHLLRPTDADSLRLVWSPSSHPGDLVLAAAERHGLTPLVVHSTSWRYDDGQLILTYVAVVERPGEQRDDLVDEPIARTDLARGDALRAPTEIATAQVVEHALRHLSWLVRDDPAVGAALSRWRTVLDGYAPEAFRAFGVS